MKREVTFLKNNNLVSKYDDCPLSNFPAAEDNWARMSDLTPSLLAVASQYNTLWDAGDLDGASALLAANPELVKTIFNADKWNKLRDAVIAVERFFRTEVETFIERVGQQAIGINDDPGEEGEAMTAYSSQKVNLLLNGMETALSEIRSVKLPASGWSASYPYSQTVSVQGLTTESNPILGKGLAGNESEAVVKAYNKAFGMIFAAEAGDGTATFLAAKKPASDLVVKLKGV